MSISYNVLAPNDETVLSIEIPVAPAIIPINGLDKCDYKQLKNCAFVVSQHKDSNGNVLENSAKKLTLTCDTNYLIGGLSTEVLDDVDNKIDDLSATISSKYRLSSDSFSISETSVSLTSLESRVNARIDSLSSTTSIKFLSVAEAEQMSATITAMIPEYVQELRDDVDTDFATKSEVSSLIDNVLEHMEYEDRIVLSAAEESIDEAIDSISSTVDNHEKEFVKKYDQTIRISDGILTSFSVVDGKIDQTSVKTKPVDRVDYFSDITTPDGSSPWIHIDTEIKSDRAGSPDKMVFFTAPADCIVTISIAGNRTGCGSGAPRKVWFQPCGGYSWREFLSSKSNTLMSHMTVKLKKDDQFAVSGVCPAHPVKVIVEGSYLSRK